MSNLAKKEPNLTQATQQGTVADIDITSALLQALEGLLYEGGTLAFSSANPRAIAAYAAVAKAKCSELEKPHEHIQLTDIEDKCARLNSMLTEALQALREKEDQLDSIQNESLLVPSDEELLAFGERYNIKADVQNLRCIWSDAATLHLKNLPPANHSQKG